jgi:hypothetical protein
VLKIGSGKKTVDNIGAGGIELFFDEEWKSNIAYLGNEYRMITHHPDTGKDLSGIKAEGIQEVIELSKKASVKFGFLGTIGWDIAFTPDGPMVIEANSLWGTNYPPSIGGFLSEEMAKGLRKHRMFSRWDKKMMYPKFHRKSRLPWKRNNPFR